MPEILQSQTQQGKSTFTEQEIPGKSLAILFCHSSIMKCRMDLNPENVQHIGTKSREVPSHRKFPTIIFVVVQYAEHPDRWHCNTNTQTSL